MSVYGRKMFKRNARETLNQTAGIKNLPTQKFNVGGSIRIGNNSFMVSPGANPKVFQRTNQGTAIPVSPNVAAQVLARFRSPQLNTRMSLEESGIGPLKKMVNTSGAVALQQPEVAGIAGATTPKGPYEPFQYTTLPVTSTIGQALFGTSAPKTVGEKLTRMGTLAIPATFEGIATSSANALLQGDAAIRETLNQMTAEREQEILSGQGTITPQEALMINAGATTLSPQLSEAILEGDIFAPGVDLLKIGASPASSGVYSKGAVSPEEEAANIQLLKNIPQGTELIIQGKDVAAPDPMQEPSQVPYYMDKGAVPTDAATAGEDATAQAAGEEAAVTAPEDREALREAGTYEKEYVSPKEEITRVINEGTPEEQEKTLDDFIKEFMDKAPGYEGTNQGLILAKMGFAMAAGKSSRAIENISSALEQGAEDLIKDSNKKAEFDRQLKLSALQYGLTETGKLDAQRRTDDRNFIRLVDGDGNSHRISMTELLENDGQLPEGLKDVDVYLAQEKAALERLDAIKTQSNALREELLISDAQASEIQKNYSEAAKIYIDAEVGMEFAEKAILKIADDGSITGIKGGIKDLSNKLANAMGFDAPPSFQSQSEYRTFVNQAFQRLIPVSLGGVQSANSISNRDVEFLANAYVDATSLQGGSWSLIFADEDVLAQKLQFTIDELRKSQALAAGQMRSIEDRLTNRILPGEGLGSGLSLISEQKQSVAPYTSSFGQRSTTGLVDTGRKNDQGMPIYSFAE